MTLWLGNGAVLKSSSQWQLKEFRKLNNSVHELFIFEILLIALTEFFKNCTINYPEIHNNCHSLRWYQWDLVVFFKQTPV